MSDDSKTPAKSRRPRKRPVAKPRAKEEPKQQPHYTIGEWHELPMFSCVHCPWSTLDEDEMVKHIASHLKTPSVMRTDTGFVTPAGAKIIREEIVEE